LLQDCRTCLRAGHSRALGAAAATLGLPTRDAPVISGAGTAFHDPSLGFNLLGDGLASSTPPALGTGLLVTVPFAQLAPSPAGALFVTDSGTGTNFLSGNLSRVGYSVNSGGSDVIELLFDGMDGSASKAFLPAALLRLTGEFGNDPIEAGFGSFTKPVDVEYTVAAVPVPTSLPLLLIAVLVLVRFRRTAAA
jgi:hypothetical protein